MEASSIKSIKTTKLLSGIVLIIFGLVFVIWPGEIQELLARIIGITFALAGLIEVIMALVSKEKRNLFDYLTMVIGGVVIVIGAFFAIKPSFLIGMFGYLIGAIIALVGLYNAYHSLRYARKSTDKWWIGLILAIGSVAFGAIIILRAGTVTEALIRFIGISMFVVALTQIWNFFCISVKKLTAKKEKNSAEEKTEETK